MISFRRDDLSVALAGVARENWTCGSLVVGVREYRNHRLRYALGRYPGKHHWIVTGHPPAVGGPLWRVIWHGESIDVPAGESVIGRDRGCAVQIDADSVSRHHARLRVDGAEASIEDLGNKNGTWVAGERILGAASLNDGINVRLGSETVRFEIVKGERPTKTAIGS